jgi:murein tripeptide amidase MpaA
VHKCKENGAPVEIEKSDFSANEAMPVDQYKNYVVLCARIHPGESNSSYIM